MKSFNKYNTLPRIRVWRGISVSFKEESTSKQPKQIRILRPKKYGPLTQ